MFCGEGFRIDGFHSPPCWGVWKILCSKIKVLIFDSGKTSTISATGHPRQIYFQNFKPFLFAQKRPIFDFRKLNIFQQLFFLSFGSFNSSLHSECFSLVSFKRNKRLLFALQNNGPEALLNMAIFFEIEKINGIDMSSTWAAGLEMKETWVTSARRKFPQLVAGMLRGRNRFR